VGSSPLAAVAQKLLETEVVEEEEFNRLLKQEAA
jgi:hypothetical protein